MKVNDVIEAMEEFAPTGLAYGWDKAGLAIGAPEDEATKVLTCLTVTRDVLVAAKRAKATMIVAHHPLIWEPLTTLRSDDANAKLCLDLASAGIACYSAHTNLDVVQGGVNDILFERLGLTRRSPLFPAPHASLLKLVTYVPGSHLAELRDAVCAAGAGCIGHYSHCSFSSQGTGTFRPGEHTNPYSGHKHHVNEEPERRFETVVPKARITAVVEALKAAHPYEEVAYDLIPLENVDPTVSLGLRGELPKALMLKTFSKQVRAALEIDHVRTVGDPKRKVRSVAVMGGAGGGSTPHIPGGVDVFVTGDVKYHEALDARERGLSIIDAGHHGTEKWIVPFIAELLKTRLKGLKVTSYMESDPFTVVAEKS